LNRNLRAHTSAFFNRIAPKHWDFSQLKVQTISGNLIAAQVFLEARGDLSLLQSGWCFGWTLWIRDSQTSRSLDLMQRTEYEHAIP